LHIVQEIARMHGGQVCVESSEPAGTAFTIELPRMVTLQRGSFTRK
jgi:signal transduction histidine kinase